MTPDHAVSRLLADPKLRVLSLGAGVQSTVLALMAAAGEIGPMPDAAIFADTGAEPAAIYDHLDWIESQVPYPIHRVSNGNIADDLLGKATDGRTRFAAIPYFIDVPQVPIYGLEVALDEDGSRRIDPRFLADPETFDYAEFEIFGGEFGANGEPFLMVASDEVIGSRAAGAGMGRRQCTKEYKLEPIRLKVRELLGLRRRQPSPREPVVEQWIGISTDEIQRLKPARDAYTINRWPLIEMRMDRGDCMRWFAARYPGRALAKSACVFCPYQTDEQWKLKRADPPSWDMALRVDKAIRTGASHLGLVGTPYLHRSMRPLEDVVFSAADQPNLFAWNECEGICGL